MARARRRRRYLLPFLMRLPPGFFTGDLAVRHFMTQNAANSAALFVEQTAVLICRDLWHALLALIHRAHCRLTVHQSQLFYLL
jgi:hypothetical protein